MRITQARRKRRSCNRSGATTEPTASAAAADGDAAADPRGKLEDGIRVREREAEGKMMNRFSGEEKEGGRRGCRCDSITGEEQQVAAARDAGTQTQTMSGISVSSAGSHCHQRSKN